MTYLTRANAAGLLGWLRKTQARRKSNGVAAAASARDSDRIAGRCVFLPVRYADDFVVLVSGSMEEAMAEKSALADYLIKTTGLTLSPEKTKVTAMTEGFEFLGFRFSAHWDKRYGYGPRVEIPKAKAANLRHKVKQLTQRDSISVSLGEKLRMWRNVAYQIRPKVPKLAGLMDSAEEDDAAP
ncbi:reverse transcriptase domain-containing protein [Rhizobium johnstonii]|uniref:reverse transcriptase domain-containing protein n=1 Tax=Rhizobium johnstonii TaxID=3019933 RepID=UPI003F9B6B61